MLIIALSLAVIGLAALVFAVVTSNALVAWVCIGASALGVILLTVDALRDRNRQRSGAAEQSDLSNAAEPTPEAPEETSDTEHPAESEPAEGGEEPEAVPAEQDQDQDQDND